MSLINTAGTPNDANDGVLTRNPERIGNRRWGTKVFISGQEQVFLTEEMPIEWNGFESITVSSTALPFTASAVESKTEAFVTVESQAVRYRVDGQVPTATVGHVLEAGAVLTLSGPWELDKFRVIRRDASDATLRVTYGVRRDQ